MIAQASSAPDGCKRVAAFDSYAHDYDAALERGIAVSGENKTFFARRRIQWLARCLGRLGMVPETVLDYGCGTGTATPFLVEILGAKSVLGVDLSSESLEVAHRARRDLPVEYRPVQQHRPDGTVDLVFCNGVFHHVPPLERPDVVSYIADCLRPGGVFALWENNPWNPGTRYIMSRIPFDRDATAISAGKARPLLRASGLEVVRTDYCFIFPRVLSAFRRVEPWLAQLPLGAQYQVLSRKR